MTKEDATRYAATCREIAQWTELFAYIAAVDGNGPRSAQLVAQAAEERSKAVGWDAIAAKF
jgi:hypothetical protein